MNQAEKELGKKRLEMANLVREVEQTCAHELSIDEKSRMEAVTGSGGLMETLGDEIKALEQRSANLELAKARMAPRLDAQMREAGIGSAESQSMVNHHGNGIQAFSKSEKITSVHTQVVPHGCGELIRARICGVNSRTPEPIRNAMSEGNNSLGGFMVPGELSGSLIDLARAKSVLVNLGMTTYVLTTGELTIARITADPTVENKSENAAFTGQTFTLGSHTMVPRTVGVLIEASRELAEDAPNFVQMVEMQLAAVLGVAIDRHGIQGFGDGNVGLTGNPNITETGTIGAIEWADLNTIATAIRVSNHEANGAIFYPSILDKLRNISTGDGVNSALGWLTDPPSLANIQKVSTTNCPSGNIVMGDFTKFAVGLRTGLMIEVSTVSGDAFKKHQVHIKATMRLDYGVLDSSAFRRLAGVTV